MLGEPGGATTRQEYKSCIEQNIIRGHGWLFCLRIHRFGDRSPWFPKNKRKTKDATSLKSFGLQILILCDSLIT
jgi:hypothetical protein